LLRQAIREDRETAADDGGHAVVAGCRLTRFREEIARLLIQPLELGRLPRLVRTHRAEQRHAALPGAQVAPLARALFEQRGGVALGPREAVHVVGQVAGEHVFAQQRMYGESRFGQRRFGDWAARPVARTNTSTPLGNPFMFRSGSAVRRLSTLS